MVGRNIMRQKKDAKRVIYMAMIRVIMVVSCVELPNKGLGRRELLLGLVVLKMKVGR